MGVTMGVTLVDGFSESRSSAAFCIPAIPSTAPQIQIGGRKAAFVLSMLLLSNS